MIQKGSYSMKSWMKEAAILATGMIILGLCVTFGISELKGRDRFVTVKGLAEMEVAADKVIWPLTFKDIGNDLTVLYNNINAKNKAIIGFLNENGITEAEISVSAPKIFDREAERYTSEKVNYRYQVTSVITVTTNQVDKVRKLMTEQRELLKQGIALVGDYEYNIQFLFTGLNDIKPQMIEEATKNARTAAEKFAKDSNSKLGKIKRANQGQFSISDRDANTPHQKNVRVVTTVEYYLN